MPNLSLAAPFVCSQRPLAQEVEQRAVELLRMSSVDAVRPALDQHQRAVSYRLVRALAADLERDDRVGISVDDERRHLNLGQVIAEVGVGERFYAVECTFRRGELRDLAVVESAGLANQVVPIARGYFPNSLRTGILGN